MRHHLRRCTSLKIRKTSTEETTQRPIAINVPDVIVLERQAAGVHAEEPRDERRRQQHGGEHRQRIKMVIGFGRHLLADFLLQEARASHDGMDLVMQRFDALDEPVDRLR